MASVPTTGRLMAPRTDCDRPAVPAPTDSEPRLRLDATRSGHRILDGRWWPRSTDPAAELPSLVQALDAAGNRPVRLLLSAAGWSRRPHHLEVDGRKVTLGYFSDQPASILTASHSDGASSDLLVIWTEPETES